MRRMDTMPSKIVRHFYDKSTIDTQFETIKDDVTVPNVSTPTITRKETRLKRLPKVILARNAS